MKSAELRFTKSFIGQLFVKFFFALFCLTHSICTAASHLSLDQSAVAVIYSGLERMHFSVSWSGGIKIGDMYLGIAPLADGKQDITARVTDYGLFKAVYPIDDTFVTQLYGPLKLPERYEVEQIERGKKVHRLIIYDQGKFKAVCQKNNNPPESYLLDGPVYNEFSAFFITRALQLNLEQQQFIPAFVDKKRHLVPVKVFGKERKETVFGPVSTIKVQPKMQFKGLYDKDGDTMFWLTDDACRVPVEIRSKILIGSLVAELTEYTNPACPLRSNLKK